MKSILLERQNDEHLAAFYSSDTIVNEAHDFGDEGSCSWGTDIHVWACTHLLKRPIQIWRYSDGEMRGYIENVVDGDPLGWELYGADDADDADDANENADGGSGGGGGGSGVGVVGSADGGNAVSAPAPLTGWAQKASATTAVGVVVAAAASTKEIETKPPPVEVVHLLFSRKQDRGFKDSNPEASGHYDLLQRV